jgi:hypothetical protein
MPQGLKISPLEFSKKVIEAYRPLIGKGLSLYLDNGLIATETLEDHKLVLKTFLQLIIDYNFNIDPAKSEFS